MQALSGLDGLNVHWLTEFLQSRRIALWGVADLRDFSTPRDETREAFPRAVSLIFPVNPEIMITVRNGPNDAYAAEYTRLNDRINDVSAVLADNIKAEGFRALALAASERTDTLTFRGDFPHKTAATRAGLGWIGRHCQLITRQFGSWVRLGTVFTDMPLRPGFPVGRSFCGRCTLCVEACPARALTGNAWHLGSSREEILDVEACDQWKKQHYSQYHKGRACGICSAVCPHGAKLLRRLSRT